MSYEFNAQEARQADRVNQSIRESGKYIGVITRAEDLTSKQGTKGIGLSFKTDSGDTANYLDLYTINSKGENLPSMQTVHAIMACTRNKKLEEGEITFEKWNKDTKKTEKIKANGFPILMGKRIGLLLQRELSDNPKDSSKPNDRVVIVGVFEADTELTASEILDKKTQPEQLAKMAANLKPLNDRTTKGSHTAPSSAPQGSSNFDDFEDDIPF